MKREHALQRVKNYIISTALGQKIFIRRPQRKFLEEYGDLPIKEKKIVFSNYMGKGFGDNPKYIAEALLKQGYDKFDMVWLISDDEPAKNFPEQIRLVNYNSKEALYEYATAKLWICNYHLVKFFRRGLVKKAGQVFVQTWHGSLGIKKIENDVDLLKQSKLWLILAEESSRETDYWISNSKFESEIYRNAFWGVDSILEYGHPRNDVFFRGSEAESHKVKEALGVSGDKKILLYTPTFREDYRVSCYDIDYKAITENLRSRFGGEWICIVRMHPRMREVSGAIPPKSHNVYDLTFYDDAQELLSASDVLISDYSSCMFDFMLSKRPVFIYATDRREYAQERGLYYPLEDTPFPIAESGKELGENILNFNLDTYKADIAHFLTQKGCIEDGSASERTAAFIINLM